MSDHAVRLTDYNDGFLGAVCCNEAIQTRDGIEAVVRWYGEHCAAAERDRLAAQLEAVKALHSKTVTYAHTQPNATSPLVLCHACGRADPCPTLLALLPSEPPPPRTPDFEPDDLDGLRRHLNDLTKPWSDWGVIRTTLDTLLAAVPVEPDPVPESRQP